MNKKAAAISLFLLSANLFARDIAILWVPPAKYNLDKVYISSMTVASDCSILSSTGSNISLKNEIVFSMPERDFVSILYFPSSVRIDYINSIQDNPYFFALKLNRERKICQEKNISQSAIVSLYGDLSNLQISLFKSLGYAWAAVGENTQKSDCVYDYEGFKMPAFTLFSSTWQVINSTCPFFVVDDSMSNTISTDTLSKIASLPDVNLITVQQAIILSTPTALSKDELSFYPWMRYGEYLNREEIYPYLSALSSARNDIVTFLNSHPAKENELMNAYSEAENIIYELRLAKDEEIDQIEEESVEKLSHIYQTMSKPVPAFVYKPFLRQNKEVSYSIYTDTNSLTFSSTDIYKSVKEFSISKNERGGLVFSIKKSTIAEIGDIAIYIDINSATGAGNTSILNGVKEKLYVKNAWDYAIELVDKKAFLYRYSFMSMSKIKSFKIVSDNDTLTFSTASGDMPQNFEKWKYVLINSKDGKIIDGVYKEINSGSIYPL